MSLTHSGPFPDDIHVIQTQCTCVNPDASPAFLSSAMTFIYQIISLITKNFKEQTACVQPWGSALRTAVHLIANPALRLSGDT